MDDVTVLSTKLMQDLIYRVEDLHRQVIQMNEERKAGISKWMTTKQVCVYLSKHENWVLLHKQELGSSKRAGTLLFKRSDVDKFIEEDYIRKNMNRW